MGQTVRNLGKGTDGQFHYADDVVLSNLSDSTCFVSGWVGLAMYGDDTAVYCPRADGTDPCHGRPKSKDAPVKQRVTETGSEHQIALEPGHRVTFSVEYEGVICLHHPYRLELHVPQDAPGHLNVVGTPICVEDPVTVTPFR